MYVAAIGRVEETIWLPYDVGLSAAAETLVRILKRVIVSPAVYPRFLEIAELARSLCHSWATCKLKPQFNEIHNPTLLLSLMVTWFLLLPLLITSVSFVILIFPSVITSLLPLVHVSNFLSHPWSSSHTPCSSFRYDSHHRHIFCSSQTWLWWFNVLLFASNAVKSPSAHP